MKISTAAIAYINQHYGSAGNPALGGVPALVEKIGAQLGAVEEVANFGARYEGIRIVKIVHIANHPNADRLHICQVDDAGQAQNVARNEDGLVQIVCGAPNLYEGMLAAWIPPGATVPSTFGKEPFVLEARELRGVVSNGMMASPRELGLSDNHERILEIDDTHIAPGTLFADAYHLHDDYIIDIENKMFTHRPDCFGWLGVAREIEGIARRAYKSPAWYTLAPEFPEVETEPLPLAVHNELPQLVPRFTAIALRGVQVHDSPVWLQLDLARMGLRPINNIVDYSNFYMLLTGQPIHIYDYDKVRALCGGDEAILRVRHPRPGETITLLNGKTITPREDSMMVAAGDTLVCMGGAMGGTTAEVDASTTNIIIEAATWDMYAMRRTSMHHGIFTDAVTRFTKGQSPLQSPATVWKIMDQIRRYAGGKIASPFIDENSLSAEITERGSIHTPIATTGDFIRARLGLSIPTPQICQLLENVEFLVQASEDELVVRAPFWRTDIEIPEDVVEEVGRLYGYEHLPHDLPRRSLAPQPREPMLQLQSQIRAALSAAGANEILSYSFVHGDLFQKVGQNRDQAFELSNALSPQLQYFRLSLTPSLLEVVRANHKAGYEQFALFGLGKAHNRKETDDEGLPREVPSLAFVFSADKKAAGNYSGAAYYQARTYLSHLLAYFSKLSDVVYAPLEGADLYHSTWIAQLVAPYEPGRSALITDKDGMIWGVVGELRPSVRAALKLPDFIAAFEFDPQLLLRASSHSAYIPLPRFPKIEQDICLKVPAETEYRAVFDLVWERLGELAPAHTLPSLGPVDIYQKAQDANAKQITLRITLASYERTLTDSEISKLLDEIATAAHAHLNAERI